MLYSLLTASSLGIACAVLSVFVVMRKWAFIGEGISHSGLGGAGVAWALAIFFPSLDNAAATYALAALCCLLTAVGIGFFSRTGRLNADAAIGVFLVATVAWGFLAQSIYTHATHRQPAEGMAILVGNFSQVSPSYAIASISICALVLLTVLLLGKEIMAYCFDPVTAEVSGVRAPLIHYTLLILISLTIVIGVRIVGSLLMTALLVLPGVTATTLTQRLKPVFTLSILTGLLGSAGGVLTHLSCPFLPPGPLIVLILLTLFLTSYLLGQKRQ